MLKKTTVLAIAFFLLHNVFAQNSKSETSTNSELNKELTIANKTDYENTNKNRIEIDSTRIKGYKMTPSGVEYRLLYDSKEGRKPQKDETILANLRMSVMSTDSVLMETFSTDQKQYLPYDDVSLKEVFEQLNVGDSVEFHISADTLFQKTFNVPTPIWIQPGERIRFVMKVEDVFTQEELQKKNMEQMESYRKMDEENLKAYIANLQNVKTTQSGLMYIIEKEGKGKIAAPGQKIATVYRGYFINGEIFDENTDREKPFEFELGQGQVIPGWDEGIALTKKGGKYKFIIPWSLAYGERGSAPIMPFTSVIFDVEIIDIK
jgi:FKBP-type peptidyl-prolyl cis-trans isomerase